MKSKSLSLLSILLMLEGFQCPEAHKATVQEPDSTKTEQIAKDDTSKVTYKYVGPIKIQQDKVSIEYAKLLNSEAYNLSSRYGETVVILDYRVLTFNFGNQNLRFLSHKVMDYSKGSLFKFDYWKLAPGQTLTDSAYLKGFIDLNNEYSIYYNHRRIDEKIEGIIDSIQHLEVEKP